MTWLSVSLSLGLLSLSASELETKSSTSGAEGEVWSMPADAEMEVLEDPEVEPVVGPEPSGLTPSAEQLFAALRRFHPLDPDPNWVPESETFDLDHFATPRSTTLRWQRTFTETGTAAFDIPIADDPRVQMWLNILRGRGRALFGKWMGRLTRWAPVYVPILERHGLPKDLIFLAMVESGLSPKAYSFANAAGPWQFIPATGRRFGLRIGLFVDERRDFERSADAAARYLKVLHREFGDWWLA